VQLCMDYHYVTVQLLTSAVFAVREQLGVDYYRFWHLLRAWAVERWRLRQIRRTASYSDEPPPEESVDLLSEEFTAVMDAFVNSTLSPSLPALPIPQGLAITWELPGHRRTARRASPSADNVLLTYAAVGLPSLPELEDPSDRQNVIRAQEEVLGQIVAEIENGELEADYPVTQYMKEGDLLHQIARTVGQMRPEESPERVFTQILRLGPSASSLVKSFLSGWFFACLGGEVTPPRFHQVWQAMIEYAWQSPTWAAGSGRSGYESREMWRELMGLDSGYRAFWKEEHAAVVDSLKPFFERWAQFDLHSRESALAFVSFLRTPAGRALRSDALVWLSAASRQSHRFWQEGALPDAIARLLAEVLTDEAELRKNSESFESFKDLLGQLCRLQNVLALAVRESMTAG
jgi:hypothetical protein